MSSKKTVLKFRREEEEGCETLMARALYVEEVEEDENEDTNNMTSEPPMDGMEYLRRVIKVPYTTFRISK